MVISFYMVTLGSSATQRPKLLQWPEQWFTLLSFTLPSLYSWGFFFHFNWKKPKSLSRVCAAPLSQAWPEKSACLDSLHLKFSASITSIFNPISPGEAAGCLAFRRGQERGGPWTQLYTNRGFGLATASVQNVRGRRVQPSRPALSCLSCSLKDWLKLRQK